MYVCICSSHCSSPHGNFVQFVPKCNRNRSPEKLRNLASRVEPHTSSESHQSPLTAAVNRRIPIVDGRLSHVHSHHRTRSWSPARKCPGMSRIERCNCCEANDAAEPAALGSLVYMWAHTWRRPNALEPEGANLIEPDHLFPSSVAI